MYLRVSEGQTAKDKNKILENDDDTDRDLHVCDVSALSGSGPGLPDLSVNMHMQVERR